MITQTAFYKEMKKWTRQKDGFAQYINFTGNEAVATNGWSLAVVKNWNTEPHQEDANGIRLKEELKFPDYRKVLVTGNDVGWQHDFKAGKTILPKWKLAFQFAEKTLRISKVKDTPVHLQKLGSKLTLYFASDIYSKIILADDLEDGYDFQSTYNVKALLKSVEFLIAAGAEKFSMYVGKEGHNRPFMVFETEELLLIFAQILLRNGVRTTDKLLQFVKNEQFRKW